MSVIGTTGMRNTDNYRAHHKTLYGCIAVHRIYLHTDPIEAGRMIYYPGNDRSLIEKSQRLLYENDKQRPAQAAVYYVAHTTKRFLGILITGIMFFFLTRIEFGRRLLQKVINYTVICKLYKGKPKR